MVTTLLESLEVNKFQKKYKTYIVTTYNYTGYPLVREIKERIKRKQIGNIENVEFEMPQDSFITNNKFFPLSKWRTKDNFIPNICLDLGTHLYSLLFFLINVVPSQVVSDFYKHSNDTMIGNAKILFKCKGGMRGTFWISKRSAGSRNGLRIRIFGNKGSYNWYQQTPEILKVL